MSTKEQADSALSKCMALLTATLGKNKALIEENDRLVRRLVAAETQLKDGRLEFVVGDLGMVSAEPATSNAVVLELLTYNLTSSDSLTSTTITPEQAFAMGNALLQVAKRFGFEPMQPEGIDRQAIGGI